MLRSFTSVIANSNRSFSLKVNKKLSEPQVDLPPADQVDLQQFMAPTPLPPPATPQQFLPPATPQQFLPPATPQQPLLQSEVPDMSVLGADSLDAVQLAGMVPTPASTPAPLLPPATPGVPPPTPGLPPATPMPLPMDVDMPQIPPDQVRLFVCLL
jgi:hypothetical protein